MPGARLTVIDPFGRRVVRIDKPIYTLGRLAVNDLQLTPQNVSKQHAEIVHDHDTYLLRDRGSTFGTFVNGEQVTEHTLRRGDRIRLGRPGSVELLFESEGPDSTFGMSSPGAPDLRQMAAIMDGLRALNSGQVLDDMLALVIDLALDTAMADRGFIMLANADGQLEFRLARRRGRQHLEDPTFAASVKIPREVFATGKPQTVDDLDVNPGDHGSTVAFGIRRVVCVPLRVAPMLARSESAATGRVIGVLYLDQHSSGKKSSTAMLHAVEAFASQAALAIESARLYAEADAKARVDRDLRVAAEIQRSLLPNPAYSGPTCELAAISIPCRTIGGDFFDYLETSEGRFAFALGDVAGKGPPAALLSAALQANFAAYVSLGGDPADTTASINRALLRRPIEARFATMFLGVLTADGQLTYCSAGHEPPIVLSPDGAVRSLDAGGVVLGLFGHAGYDSETIQLSPGDLIVVCSDGLTEARSPNGQEFGRDQVIDVVSRCPDRKAETVLDHLIVAVRAFSAGAPQADDVTVMVIRVGPPE